MSQDRASHPAIILARLPAESKAQAGVPQRPNGMQSETGKLHATVNDVIPRLRLLMSKLFHEPECLSTSGHARRIERHNLAKRFAA